MPKPRVKVKLGNRPKVKMEIARYLVTRYAPEARLILLRRSPRTKKGRRYTYIDVARPDSHENNEIHWSPENGLAALLHEIGHHRIEGRSETKKKDELLSEALAWLWAEWAAQQENLWFDYHQADAAFASYTGKAPISINWRKRNVFT